MQILSADQIRALDQFTIAHDGIVSLELMERAGMALATTFAQNYPTGQVCIICGPGNNGGDGLVMARILGQRGRSIKVVVVSNSEKTSPDFATNLKRIPSTISTQTIVSANDLEIPEVGTVVIDALFGTGLSRPLEGLYAHVVKIINQWHVPVVSIDLPSGLMASDNRSNKLENVIKATHTLTIHAPKLAFLLPETGPLVGEWSVVDIGLAESEWPSNSHFHFTTAKQIARLLPPRPKFSHKGTFGHALLLAGSKGKIGAARLAAASTTRSGAGLTTVAVPQCGLDLLQMAVPEAMCLPDADLNHLSQLPKLDAYTAIGVGPGIGLDRQTSQVIKLLIQESKVPMVLDADALNILADNKTWLAFLPPNSILTPHPKEFDRLFGNHTHSFSRLETLREQAIKLRCIIVLKGAYTAIALPDGSVRFNSTGNPGMATGGSGDVLTGVILGLLAQKFNPAIAAILGVYTHGLAGDLAVGRVGQISLLASDIVGHLPAAFRQISE